MAGRKRGWRGAAAAAARRVHAGGGGMDAGAEQGGGDGDVQAGCAGVLTGRGLLLECLIRAWNF